MSRKYEVIALSVGGQNNKIFKNGDKVDDSNFGKDRADELVKGGFLKPLDDKKNAGELIDEIGTAETVEQVDEIVGDYTQKSVLKAAKEKKAELTKAAEELALEEQIKAEEVQKLVDAKLVEIAKCETVAQVEELVAEDDNEVIKKAIEDKVADIKAAEQD